MKGEGLGMMQCYCKTYSKEKDDISKKICKPYTDDRLFKLGLTSTISAAVVFVNLILRAVGTYLISKIGLNLNDEVVTNIMTLIFIC